MGNIIGNTIVQENSVVRCFVDNLMSLEKLLAFLALTKSLGRTVIYNSSYLTAVTIINEGANGSIVSLMFTSAFILD